MKNLLKKIDNFIVNKINFKSILYFILGCIMINCFNYYVLKYRINNLDNILMIFALNLSTLSWFNFYKLIKNNR